MTATVYGTQNPGVHPSVQEATAAGLPAYSYSAGVITASANGALTVDGIAVSANDRVLVKNETSGNAPYNGIYVVTATGGASAPFVLTRAPDMATGPQVPGSLVLVEQGTQAGQLWQVVPAGPFTIGVTNITWTQFTGGVSLPVGISQGGTGATTQQGALDAIAGAVTSGLVLRGNGTHVQLAALQASDIPDLAYVDTVTAADTSLVVGGTSDAPTVRTNTLDVIAFQRPPAAAVGMNSQKLTSLANGTAATDGAAFGQIPTSAGAIGGLLAANNLSDVANAATARGNLGAAQDTAVVHLAGAETITGSKTFNVPPNLATQPVSGTATLSAASAPVVLTDTTTAAFTLTLPASPTTGEFFIVVDDTGQWATHNLTIGRNGKNIDGVASNLTLQNQWGKVWLYYDGTAWWAVANGISNETPVALGSASAGTHNSPSRTDHIHPTTGLVTGVTAGDASIVVGGTGQAPTIETGTLDAIATGHPPAAAVPMNGKNLTNAGAAGVTLPWFTGLFGDGSDGAVTFDGSSYAGGNSFCTTIGSAPNLAYTLTRNLHATNVTVSNGVTVSPAGWMVFCQGTWTDNAGTTVSLPGINGNASGTATAATGAGSLGGGLAGAGGQTGNGSAGNSSNSAGLNSSGGGGAGSSGTGGAAGAAGTSATSWYKTPFGVLTGVMQVLGVSARLTGGPGGGGGGGDGTNKGGGGGSGGGLFAIFAWAIVHNGAWNAPGGNGGSPATVVTNGGCGGGGGGAGGLFVTYSLTAVTGSGTSNVAGGTGGTKVTNGSGTAANGSAGSAGGVVSQVLS